MSHSNPNEEMPPVLSLSLSYRFGPGDAEGYLNLPAEQKAEIDKQFMTQLLMTDTFGVRQSWFVLEIGPGIEYLDRDVIRNTINSQFQQLNVHGHPNSVAKVTEKEDLASGQAIYLILPPNEHRVVYYLPVSLDDGSGSKPTKWRLYGELPSLSQPLRPRVTAALTAGFPIPTDELTPDDRFQLATSQTITEMLHVLKELAEEAGHPNPKIPNSFEAGGMVEPVGAGGDAAAKIARLTQRMERMQALHARMRR